MAFPPRLAFRFPVHNTIIGWLIENLNPTKTTLGKVPVL